MSEQEEKRAQEENEAQSASVPEYSTYEFGQQKHLEIAYPLLDIINENFQSEFQKGLFSLLRKDIEVKPKKTQTINYQNYICNFDVPTSFTYMHMPPLKGTALVTFQSKLVYILVNHYFGGGIVLEHKNDRRHFTALERRVLDNILGMTMAKLHEAWQPVFPVTVNPTGSETNPFLVSIVPDDELVVVTEFSLNIEDSEQASFFVVFPYAMLQPIRGKEDLEIKQKVKESQSLGSDLADCLNLVPLELSSTFAEATISLGELLSLQEGDFIPIKQEELHVVEVEDKPMFRAKLGVFDEHYALRIMEKIED